MASGPSGRPPRANLNEFIKEINRKWAPGRPGRLREQILMNLLRKSIVNGSGRSHTANLNEINKEINRKSAPRVQGLNPMSKLPVSNYFFLIIP